MRKRLNEEKYTKLFEKLLDKKGWRFTPATQEEDMFHHIDGHIHIYDLGRPVKSLTVDLKGHKFKSRNSNVLCQYIEFMNVRGEKGWLFGEADYIAVLSENEKTFYLMSRQDIIDYCEKIFHVSLRCSLEEIEAQLLKLQCWVDKSQKACHKLYRRKRLKDIVTQITMEDVKKLTKIIL